MKHFFYLILRGVLVPLSLLLLLAAAIYGGRFFLVNMAVQYIAVPVAKKSAPGLELSVGSARSDLVSNLDLRDIKVSYRLEDGNTFQAQLPRTLVYFSISHLRESLDAFIANARIEAEIHSAAADLVQAEKTADASENAAINIPLPAISFPLPEIGIKYGSLTVSHPESQIVFNTGEIASRQLSAEKEDTPLQLLATANHFSLTAGEYKTTAKNIAASFSYHSGSLEMKTLTVDEEEIARNFLLQSEPGKAYMQAFLTIWGGAIDLKAEIAELVRISFKTSGISIEQSALPSLGGGLPSSGSLDGSGDFSFAPSDPAGITGDILLSLGKTSFFSYPIDSFKLKAHAAEGILYIDGLSIVTPEAKANFEKVELPLPSLFPLNVPELASQASGVFDLSFANIQSYAAMLPEGAKEYIILHKIALLEAAGKYGKGTCRVQRLKARSENTFVQARDLLADLTPLLEKEEWRPIPFKASLLVETIDNNFLKYFSDTPIPLKGGLSGKLQLDGSLGSLKISFDIDGKKFSYNDLYFDAISTEGAYLNNELIIRSIRAANDLDTLEGAFKYQTESPHALSGEIEIAIAELENYLSGDLEQYRISGDLKGKASFSGAGEDFSGNLSLQSNTLVYDDNIAKDVAIAASLSGNNLSVQSLQATLPDQDLTINSALDVELLSRWDNFLVHLNEFSIVRMADHIALKNPATIDYSSGLASTKSPVTIQYRDNLFSLEGSVSAETIDLKLTGGIAKGVDFLKPFAPLPFSFADASFKAGASGAINNPDIIFSGSIKQITSDDTPPLDGNISFSFADETLQIEQFILSDADFPRLKLQGELPLSIKNKKLEFPEKALKLSGNFDLRSSPILPWLFQKHLEEIGSLQGTVELQGTWQSPSGKLQLGASDLLFKNGPDWLPPEPIALDISITAKKDQILLNAASASSSRTEIKLHGSATARDFFKLMTQPDQRDLVLSRTAIDLKGSLKINDIDWLADLSEMLRRISGQVDTDFHVTGTITEPHFDAVAALQNGEIRLSSDVPTLEDIVLQTRLSENSVEINQFSGSLGGAPIKGSGSVNLPKDNGALSLDLKVSGKDLLFYRAEGVKFRGDASLAIHGSADQPQLDGAIQLTDSSITKNVDFISSLLSGLTVGETPPPRFPAFTEPPLKNARLNLTLKAKQPVLLANNMLKGNLSPDLRLQGTGEVPFLTGTIYLDSGSLALPAGKVKIDSGLVRFLKTDPDRPVLELTGNTKMHGYDITAGVSGPYDAPVVTLSSTPTLASEDLLLLLLTGMRPSTADVDSQGQSKNYSSVAVYLGRNLLDSIWSDEDAENETSLLDRLQLEIGKNITQQGEETIEAQFILAENIRNGNNAILLTGEKDVWDKYNGGLRLVFKFK